MTKFVILSAAVLASISATNATSLSIPAALYSIDLGAGANSNGVCCAASASYTAPGSYALSDASTIFSTSPDFSATASVGGLAGAGGNAFYYVGVIGATPGVEIPLLVAGSLSASASGSDANASASLTVGSPLLQSNAAVATGGVTSWSGTLDIEYDSQYGDGSGYVEINISAQNGGSDGGATAFADPYIYVDPSFANAASYSVVVSQGVGNTASTAPEPGTLALLGGGFLALVYRLRSQRIRKSAMAACLMLPAAILIPQTQAATITFSGATAFNANSDGSWNNGGITATGTCCQVINVEPTTFTGSGNVALPLTLALGTDVLYLESSDWTAGFSVATGGVDLFFDGNLSPNISAYTTPTYDKTSATTFTKTGSGLPTASLTDSSINSANSLSYNDGTDTVTLTGLQWVGGSGANPYSASETVQKVTLSVTADNASAAPEPGSLLLIAAGLTALGIFGRRR